MLSKVFRKTRKEEKKKYLLNINEKLKSKVRIPGSRETLHM